MKNNAIIIPTITAVLMLLLLLVSCKKEVYDPALTQEYAIQSTANGAMYNIKVGLPSNYDPVEKYASIYVLDGEENFDFVSTQCKKISDQLGVANVVVVSIGYGTALLISIIQPSDILMA